MIEVVNRQVVRAGRRVEVSIYDIVVGDIVPLNIGDQASCSCVLSNFYFMSCVLTHIFFCLCAQVPADGIMIAGHSLAIDESSMTGESKIVSCHHRLEVVRAQVQ